MPGFLSHYGPRKPRPHKETHEDNGLDEVSCSGLVGRSNFVCRGVKAIADWDETDLSVVGSLTDLDCSSIVPSSARLILFHSVIHSLSSGKLFLLVSKDDTNTYPRFYFRTQTSVDNVGFQSFCVCDASQVVQYLRDHSDIDSISLWVDGWVI